MNLWFGEPWPQPDYRADVCRDDRYRVPTPVGQACYLCDVAIASEDRGQLVAGIDGNGQTVGPMAGHIECMLRTVTGCSDLYQSGQTWAPGHVCSGADSYREDALLLWRLMFGRTRS